MKTTKALPILLIEEISETDVTTPNTFLKMVNNGELNLTNKSECIEQLNDLYEIENDLYWESWDLLLQKAILKIGIYEFKIENVYGDIYAIPIDITYYDLCKFFDIDSRII